MTLCLHTKTTWPQRSARLARDYVVCLGCGSEFLYDFREMRRGERIATDVPGRMTTYQLFNFARSEQK